MVAEKEKEHEKKGEFVGWFVCLGGWGMNDVHQLVHSIPVQSSPVHSNHIKTDLAMMIMTDVLIRMRGVVGVA